MVNDPRIVLILLAAAIVTVGAKKLGHGVKAVFHKTATVAVHVVKHPVDSAKNGAATKDAKK